MFFGGWESIGRIVLLATVVYILLVLALRIAGARALAKMSAYDLVVTIALGSLIATIPLQESVTLADGITAIAVYLVLQRVLSLLLTRWKPARGLMKSGAKLVLWDGEMLHERMRSIPISDAEVRAAVRSAGLASIAHALAVVLENDGSWSVVRRGDPSDLSAISELDPPWPLAARES